MATDERAYLSPEDLMWSEPTNNDLPPTEPGPGDAWFFESPDDLPTWDEAAALHEALMGGWCSRHPDRPPGGRIVGHYEPGAS